VAAGSNLFKKDISAIASMVKTCDGE